MSVLEYIPDCYYRVDIDGTIIGFSKVENLTMSYEGEAFKEGGSDAVAKTLEKKNKSIEILKLEKGISKDLPDMVAKKLIPGCYIKAVSIIILNELYEVEKVFNLFGGTVTKRNFSSLNATSGNVLMVNLEISHSGLIEEISE